MRYLELPPPPLLRPYLRCLWLLEDGRGGAGEVERVLPDGCVEIIVHYGTPMRRCDDGTSAQPRSIVGGQIRSAMHLVPTGPLGMVAARFQPWAAAPFLRESLELLTDRIVPLDAVWGRDASRLEERIGAAPDDEARFAFLSDALAARLLPADDVGRGLRAAVGWITDSNGAVPVEQIARRLGWSRRRLERHFTASVGLTPKALCRIERFQHVVQSLGSERPPRLVDLAYHAGYADQSHLAREFRSLAGLPVTHYLAEQHTLSDHLTRAARDADDG